MHAPYERTKWCALQPSEILRPTRPYRPSYCKRNMATSCGTGEASHPRWGQESDWLLLHLPGHYMHQPNGAQECHGALLPHSIRADTSITPFCPITKDLPSGGTAGFSCLSCIGAQTVPLAQKMVPFPRACGEHTFGGTSSKVTPVGHPSSKQHETLPQNRALKQAVLRHLAGTQTW